MLLLTQDEPLFTSLITEEVPRLAKWQPVRDLMKKYTSGYLTGARLDQAMRAETFPTISLATIGGGAGGDQLGNDIRIDAAYFKAYKDGAAHYPKRLRITVLHEVAHWGYRKGQDDGNKSDKDGRAHNNHGENLSPLSAELEKLIDTMMALMGARPLF